ncbi:MAG: leucine-rich repeat protein [Bacteroidales bacterium]|nr:leucine-rich repeat protein [Bacteroidales bacterium]
MKKPLSLALVLMLSVLMPRAWAQTFEAVAPTGQTLSYVIENGEAVVGNYNTVSGALTIPESVTYEGTTYTVARLGWGAFNGSTGLTSVTLPASLTVVGGAAFSGCSSLTQVHYAGTLAQWVGIEWHSSDANPLQVAHHLYVGGQEVVDAVIPEGVTLIKSYAFVGCSGLETVTFPSTLDSVGMESFSGCSGLARVYCTSLAAWCRIGFDNTGSSPLMYAHKLYVGGSRVQGTMTIPTGVTAIKPYAFYGLNGVSKVELPEGLLSVGRFAFWDGDWSVSYNVPSTVTTMGEYAFYGGGPVYYDAVNCTVVRNDTWSGAVAIPYVYNMVMGEGVQRIPRFLLPYDDNLSTLTMRGSVPPQVANYAFDNMRSRAIIKVPCGASATYQAAAGWDELTNTFQETLPYTIQFSQSEHGSAWCQQEPTCTSMPVITAAGYQYWHFVRWSDGNTSTTRTVNLTQDTMFTPVFERDRYYICANPWPNAEYGEVLGCDSVDAESTITLTARPRYGYYFQSWSDGSTDSVRTISATYNWWADAYFYPRSFSVTVQVDPGTPYGTVGGDSTGTFLGIYQNNYTITATPAQGYQFVCWSDGDSNATRTITVLGDTVISARFALGHFAVTGTPRIVYDAQMDSTLPIPTSFSLFDFQHGAAEWTVVENGATNRWHIGTLEGNQALFVSADGGVTNDYNENITSNAYAYTQLQLTAGENSYRFDWRCNGESCCDYLRVVLVPDDELFDFQWGYNGVPNERWIALDQTNDGNRLNGSSAWVTRTGSFEVPTIGVYKLVCYWYNDGSVKGLPAAAVDNILITAGPLAPESAGEDSSCYVLGSDTVVFMDSVTLTAVAGPGYHFIRWSDGDTVNPRAVVADGDQMLYAYFGYDHFNISVASDDTVNTVTDYNAADDNYLSNHVLQATPAAGYHFTQWNDGNTDNPRTIVLTQDTSFTASFVKDVYTVEVFSSDTTMGHVYGGGMAEYLDTLTLTAVPVYGYHFVRWNDNDEGWQQAVRRVVVAESKSYTAIFSMLEFFDTVGDVVFQYTHNGQGLTLVGVNGTLQGAVAIPDSVVYEGSIYPVTEIAGYVFSSQTGMTTVTLPKGLTNVGYAAFGGCTGLTRVYFSGTVAQWCAIEFDGWNWNPTADAHHLYIGGQEVINLVVPEGVTSIGAGAFAGLTSMTSVTLPSTLDTIGTAAFEGCNGLLRVNYTGTVADWCNIGFYEGSNPLAYARNLYIGGSKVTNLVIPEGVTAIKPYAFHGLQGLTSVEFPEGLLSIGRYAFESCWGITYTIPSTVTSIGEWALRGSNVYFNAANCTNLANNAMPDLNFLVVGEEVQTLPTNLIINNTQMVKMQGMPPVADEYAFDRLPSSAQVQVKCGYLSFYQSAPVWSTLTNLVETNTYGILFGNTEHGSAWVQTEATCSTSAQVYASAYQYYHFVQWTDGVTDNPRTINLTQDTLLTPVFAIDTYQVQVVVYDTMQGWVSGGGSVEAGQSLTIEARAKQGYQFERWDDWELGYQNAVRTVTPNDNRTYYAVFIPVYTWDTVGDVVFQYSYNGWGLTLMGVNGTLQGDVVIPDSVMYEGSKYPVTVIANAVFSNQTGMTTVTLPNGLTRVEYSFDGCTGLTRVYFNGTVAQWCAIEFGWWDWNPTALAHHLYIGGQEVINLVVPEGVTSIGRDAFYGLTSMTSVTLPSTLDTIGQFAFGDCNGLVRVNYNGTLADWCNIGFYEGSTAHTLYIGGNKVTNLVIPEGVTAIKPYAFYGIQDLVSVVFPEGLQCIGHHAFEGVWSVTYTIPSTVTSIGELALRGNTVYFNAANCTNLANNAMPDLNTIVVGEGVQTLPTNLITTNTYTLRMQGMPPVADEYAFDRLRSDAQVQVPCGYLSLYQSAPAWSTLTNMVETNTYAIRFGNDEYGSAWVTIDATCTTPAQVVAGAYQYYHFVRWTDGVTDNPRTISLTQDTLLTPVFAIDTYYVYGNTWPSDEYGYVEGADTVQAGDTLTLVAHANYGFHFTSWGDNGSADSIRTVIASSYMYFDAYFERNNYNVTAMVDPVTPYGTVMYDDGFIYLNNDTITIERPYNYETVITAIPQYGYHFTQWSDGVTDAMRYFNVLQDTLLVAQFEINTYSIVGTTEASNGYFFGFENAADDAEWTLDNGNQTNQWYIGTGDANYGSRMLYVSGDGGLTNDYNESAASTVYAYTQVQLATGEYNYSFDWRCNGESSYDYLRVALVPNDESFNTQWGSNSVPGANWIALDQNDAGSYRLNGSSNWVTRTGSFDVAVPGQYKLVFYWRNDGSVKGVPPAAVDNIALSQNGLGDTSSVARGSVYGSDTVPYLDTVTLTAVPEYGFHFLQWDDGDTSNPRTVVADMNRHYVAVFGNNTYNVSLVSDNAEHGSVAGAGSYAYLTPVVIDAIPAYGYHFSQWTDNDTNNPRTVVLTCDTSFTAKFLRNSYNVAAQAEYADRGTVAVSSPSVFYLDTVTVTATPAYGYHFAQWSDGVTDNPRLVVVSEDVLFTAQFDFNQYTVGLSVDDSVHGLVSGAGSYNYLTNVTIEAAANDGYHFTQWSDGVTDNPRTVTLTQDTAFTALYAKNVYTLTLTSNDDSLGTVTGGGMYEYLDEVQIVASVVADHFHFVQWSDGVTDSVRTITVTADLALNAIFAIDTHTVTTVVRLGTAEGVSDYSTCGTVIGTGSYPYGTVLDLEANAADGYHFAEWDNGERTLTRTVAVTQDTLIAAVFTDDVIPSLCMVSVQNGRNTLTWSKDIVVERYNIYREANTAGVYAVVASVPFDSLSMWVDTASHPSTRSYRYKMTAVDVYGYESDFGAVHKTMHLTISQGIGTNWNLVWTEYEGAEYTTYVIYRGTNASNIEEIDIMPSGGNTTYTDETAPEGEVYYQVGIMLTTPCNPTKASSIVRSNIATNGSLGISNVERGDFIVFSRQGSIVVEGVVGMPVTVYDVAGRRIAGLNRADSDATEFTVTSGVYLVKVGNYPARRVVVTR